MSNSSDQSESIDPFAFLALILVTSLFLSAIIFQSNTSSASSPTLHNNLQSSSRPNWPIVISTWNFVDAVEIAYDSLRETNDSLNAVLSGCGYCEHNPWDCGWSVGYGAKPDSVGEVTLDAMIMYGPTHKAGAVGQLRNIKNAIGVAHAVMQHTTHTLLVGESATAFAVDMGFKYESLGSERSVKVHSMWTRNQCQPNSYITPLADTQCPPYHVEHHQDIHRDLDSATEITPNLNVRNHHQFDHDTIGMIAIDEKGFMTVGASTNGLRYKVHGRVGDAAIPGAGGYVQQGIGGAVATGNGDVMMLYAPTRVAVSNMERGMSVQEACDDAMQSIVNGYADAFDGALICMDGKGKYAVSKYMSRPFHYVLKDRFVDTAKLMKVD